MIKKIILSLYFLLFTVQCISQQLNPPEWSYDKAIYEVNIRQFTEEGSINAFEKHLPRLKKLGADILWFMPIHPIGKINRKGKLGSYYSVHDYKAVNPEFGSLKDFKMMVNKIHKMGMYVIIDWVANHTAWDHQWITDHPDFYTKDSLGNIVPPNPDWTDVADLNYDNKELWREMINALKFWVEECDIDGYRCDVSGMIPIKFWIEARTKLEKLKNVFMLAEWDTPEQHKAFDMSYDWSLHKILNAIAGREKTVKDLIIHLKKDEKKYSANAFRMQFTSNHDENSWNGTVYERLGNGVETFAILACLIADMPLVYTGQEAGNDKRLSFFEKDLVDWKEHKYSSLYSKLFALKKENKSLHNGERGGELILINSSDDENIFAFTRSKDKDKILAIFNLCRDAKEFTLEGEKLTGTYKNYFTGKIESFLSEEDFKLGPWDYKVFVK